MAHNWEAIKERERLKAEAAEAEAKEQQKKRMNRIATAMGIESKAGRKVFRPGRAALVSGAAVGADADERLAEHFNLQSKDAKRILREGRRAV